MSTDNVVRLIQPGTFDDQLTTVLRDGARALLTKAIEAEVAEFLGKHADLKTEDGRARVVRHGHLPEREVMTGIGPVAVRQPRVRDREAAIDDPERIRFSPTILPPYMRRSKSIEMLLPILYLKGISTGDFSEALSALLGKDAAGLSASAIGRLKDGWQDDHAVWAKRDLSAKRYVYIWADGIHMQARMEDEKQCNRIVSGLQSLASVFSFLIVFRLNRTGALSAWLQTRAEAERLRGKLFADLLEAAAPRGADPARVWSEKLALFGDAHLRYQRGFFTSAATRHGKAAQKMSVPRLVAFGAIGIAGLVGVVTFFDLWPSWLLASAPWLRLPDESMRWQLGLNTVASGLMAYASARTLMNQDERNAALYRHTGERLDRLREAEDIKVAAAAEAGAGERVLAYTRAAQAILDADHVAWQHHRPPAVETVLPPASVKA